MKLHDFFEAESDTANARQIASTLRRAGYKKLGAGADATVWAKDGDTVIKILMPDFAGSAAANVFIKFYEFCQQHQDVPCLPKFREIGGAHHTPFVIGDTTYTQIAMERLYPIPDGSFDEAMVWILSDLATKPITWEQASEIIKDAATWEGFAYPKKISDILRVIDQLTAQDVAEFSLLFKVMQLLYATGRINKMGWDLHTENVMQRANGTLVIVDPWFADDLGPSLKEVNQQGLAENDEDPVRLKIGNSIDSKAWIEKVYAKYPQTWQNNHVMPLGDEQFAMFELVPSFSKRGAVEVKWFQAYPLRQGVGSRAMKELQALAREDGISLTLFPWDKGQVSQAKLTKFYRGQGFSPAVKGSKALQWNPEVAESLGVDVPGNISQ